MQICKCEEPTSGPTIWNGDLALRLGHTDCLVIVCDACGGLHGFPHANLLLANEDGTDGMKATLREAARREMTKRAGRS